MCSDTDFVQNCGHTSGTQKNADACYCGVEKTLCGVDNYCYAASTAATVDARCVKPPSTPNTAGVVVNTVRVTCGSDVDSPVCAANMLCNVSLAEPCVATGLCAHTSGAQRNDGTCECGSGTGRFCQGGNYCNVDINAADACAGVPRCINNNGYASNSNDCFCLKPASALNCQIRTTTNGP